MGLFNKMRYDSVLNGLEKSYKALKEDEKRKYCILQTLSVIDAFGSGRHAKQNGRIDL